jgi:hypothetical protein
MLNDAASKSSVVIDREPDQDKSLEPYGPCIRCPLCGWSPRRDDLWSCDCRHLWNTFDTGGVVATLGLVCEMTLLMLAFDGDGGTSSESEASHHLHPGSTPRTAAKAETTDYARAFRRAFDWQQRCRLR